MTHLLEKETPFVFSKDCIDAFKTLKKKRTKALILVVPDWNLPFELMCDASDFAIDAVLGQYHLSRLENPHKDVFENKYINENFPLETLGKISSRSTTWFADFANFHAGKSIVKGMSSQQKKKFFKDCMRTRNSYFPNNSSVTIPRRRNKRRTPNVVEPELLTIIEVAPMADNRTKEELLQAPTEGYGEVIVIPEINADPFEIKTNLLQLIQASPYHGFERENPHTHINNFQRMTSTLRFRDVPNDAIRPMIFPYSLEGAARVWYDKEPPNSILTWEDLVNKFVNQFFHPSKTTHLKNEISQLAQIDTFYNGLNDNDQDSLNDAAGGNLLSKTTREALNIIENKSKVRYSRNKPNVYRMNTTSKENASKTDDRIDKLADQISTLDDIFAKKVVTPAPVKAVEKSCVTCGGPHAHYNCDATISNQPSVCMATGTYNQVAPQNRASNYMAPLNQSSTSGTLLSNTIPNLKGEMKAITTRSGVSYEGTSIPTNPSPKKVVKRETEETTNKVQTNFQGSTAHIQPSVTSILELDVPKTLPKPNIPYPLRLNDQNLCEKATNQIEKFFQIFQDLHFDISFADALLLMPKFTSTIKSLLTNKDKLFELAKIPLNENFSAILLKKLRDPRKFLIPYVAKEEYAQEILGFSKNSSGGNPTSTSEPILSDSSLSLTPFKGSDFILEEIEAYLKDESISLEIDHADCDPEGDICLIENLLNNDPFQLPPMDLKQ
nr:reverse transcriptase domain-containing protein [Tanacetum cinerariifolium]